MALRLIRLKVVNPILALSDFDGTVTRHDTPQLVCCIQSFSFSLEFFHLRDDSSAAVITQTLQTYLCASPQLLHLRAPLLEYSQAHMDLYNRLVQLTVLGIKSVNN
ncbi:hypothetical protein KI688_000687 [Linnemannia hyalina]|uniref:HAD-like protein n=1 Tax=Linnemannia hyalina TaxID=64524 RepID=A0A9P7Y522_9FUNG|nr:hypothetical protein KI688_000687 [Linnemannia hyalina]